MISVDLNSSVLDLALIITAQAGRVTGPLAGPLWLWPPPAQGDLSPKINTYFRAGNFCMSHVSCLKYVNAESQFPSCFMLGYKIPCLGKPSIKKPCHQNKYHQGSDGTLHATKKPLTFFGKKLPFQEVKIFYFNHATLQSVFENYFAKIPLHKPLTAETQQVMASPPHPYP